MNSESQFDNFTADDEIINRFVDEDPVDPKWPIVNVTNVSPHAKKLDSNKVQIAYWQLVVLVCLGAMDLGLLFGLIVIW